MSLLILLFLLTTAVGLWPSSLDIVFVCHRQSIRKDMEGLLKYQSFVIESLEQENHKFQEESSFDFESLLKDGRKYHEKVLLLKKDVTLIQDKSQRLKERALKLKDRKMKEALDMEFKRDHIQEQEKKLQPLTPSPKTSS